MVMGCSHLTCLIKVHFKKSLQLVNIINTRPERKTFSEKHLKSGFMLVVLFFLSDSLMGLIRSSDWMKSVCELFFQVRGLSLAYDSLRDSKSQQCVCVIVTRMKDFHPSLRLHTLSTFLNHIKSVHFVTGGLQTRSTRISRNHVYL